MTKFLNPFTLLALTTTLAFPLTNINKARAATITYDFDVAIDSGSLIDEEYSGFFSFDDAALTGIGEEFLAVANIEFDFLGTTYTQADALATPEAVFLDGDFLGLGYDTDVQFSFIPGFFALDEAFFSYDIPSTGTGAGDINYTLRDGSTTSVPESSTLFTLLLLGFLGCLTLFVKPSFN